LGKNDSQRCLILKNGTQRFHKNTRGPFFEGHTEKFCGEILQAKSHKSFWASLGKFRQNPLDRQKLTCS